MTTLFVAIGGVVGRWHGGDYPLNLPHRCPLWSTVGINIAGSFFLGSAAAQHWSGCTSEKEIGVGS